MPALINKHVSMKTNTILITVLIVITSTLGILNYQTHKQQKDTAKKIEIISLQVKNITSILKQYANNTPAPKFELKDSNGKLKSLDSFRHKKLLIFGASECEYCEKYYPILDEYALQHKNIDVIVVNTGNTAKENKILKQKYNYHFTILEGNESVLKQYNITQTPSTFFIDEKNNVLNAGIVGTSDQLLDLIASSM